MNLVDANGTAIPALGFGTFRMSSPEALRMVAAAQICRNEAAVGEAVATTMPMRFPEELPAMAGRMPAQAAHRELGPEELVRACADLREPAKAGYRLLESFTRPAAG